MNIFRIFDVTGSGMSAQRTRMSVVAGNLANAETTCALPKGELISGATCFSVRCHCARIFRPCPSSPVYALAAHRQGPQSQIHAVEVAGVQASTYGPLARSMTRSILTEQGRYVSSLKSNTMEEMTDLLSATRS